MTSKTRSAVPEERNYFKEVRFRQIRALVETARCGSFAEASRQLGMASPSVWRQVRALEEEIPFSSPRLPSRRRPGVGGGSVSRRM